MKPVNFYSVRQYFFPSQAILLFAFSIFFVSPSFSIAPTRQLSLPDSSQKSQENTLNKKAFWWITAGHAVGYGGSLAALASVWYDDFDRSKLHAFNDMDEWGGMDKLGHVNTAWQLANFSYSLYRYSGLSQKKAALVGSSFSMLYQTTLEFFDGYSAKWGFSFGDMGANLLGATLAYFRNTDRLRNFHFKYSWWETKYPRYRPDVLGKTIPEQMLKDYNGQTYWVSINLPKKWFRENRNWLCFSVGYSIDGFTGGKQNYFDEPFVDPPAFDRVGEFYLSLDLDFSRFNIQKKWLKQVLKVFNVVKLPFPAVGINTGGQFLFRPLGY